MLRPIASAKALVVVVTMLVSGPDQARAWKVDAHVWVAAEVLKDAADGSILIDLSGKRVRINLPLPYAAALKAHPRSFLLGSLGPDAFPDVIGGQNVIHPSYPGG